MTKYQLILITCMILLLGDGFQSYARNKDPVLSNSKPFFLSDTKGIVNTVALDISTETSWIEKILTSVLKSTESNVGKRRVWQLQNVWADPFVFRLIVGLICYFIFNAIILLLFILQHSLATQIRETRKKRLRNRFLSLITAYLFEDKNDRILKKLKSIKEKSQRQILINEIVLLLNNLSGEISQQLKNLYVLLKLRQDSVHKLSLPDWQTIIQGIKELEALGIKEEIGAIQNLLNHHNREIRVEAHYAYLKMSENDPWFFLNHLKYPLTSWEQLNLYFISKVNKLQVPEFENWLHSGYLSVVLFCLKMIALYGQLSAAPSVMELLQHENEKVRRYAIETLSILYYEEASPEFRKIYPRETYSNKKQILKAMRNLQDNSSLGFFISIFEKEDDFTLRFLAAQALVSLNETGINALQTVNPLSIENKAIIKHVLDKRIK